MMDNKDKQSKSSGKNIIVGKDELLEIKSLAERQNHIHNQMMLLKDLMIRFAAEYPNVVKAFWEKFDAAPKLYDMDDAKKRQDDLLQKAKEAEI